MECEFNLVRERTDGSSGAAMKDQMMPISTRLYTWSICLNTCLKLRGISTCLQAIGSKSTEAGTKTCGSTQFW